MAKEEYRLTFSEVNALGTNTSPRTFDAWEALLLECLERISLTEPQHALIEARYETVGEIFETSKKPELQGAIFLPQGSFRVRTVIMPPNGSVDVDAVLWSPRRDLAPAKFYQLVRDELRARVRTDDGIEEKNRCVRVLYAGESPAFHIDVTPAINDPANSAVDGSGKLLVPDLQAIRMGLYGFKPSNPVDFSSWLQTAADTKILIKALRLDEAAFRGRAETQPLPSHEQLVAFDPLRGTIRLLKAHRDKYFGARDDKPISVIITTLATKAYLRVAARNVPMRPLDAILAIVSEMQNCFDPALAGEHYRVLNPRNNAENFAEKWNADPALPTAFDGWRSQLLLDLRLGLVQFDSRVDFVEHLDHAFGPNLKALAEESVQKALQGQVLLGLSQGAAERLHNSAVTRVFGVTQDVRSQPQRVEKIERLG